jgi:hypothetical protein
MGIIKSKILQDSQTVVSDGERIYIHDVDTLVVSVSGTATAFTVQFLASLDGKNYFPVTGSKLSDFTAFSTTTSTKDEAWEFDVSALAYFKAKITSVTGGNVTVVANATN